MKNLNIISLSIIVLTALYSCQENSLEMDSESNNLESDRSNEVNLNVLSKTSTVYTDYFAESDITFGYNSIKKDPFSSNIDFQIEPGAEGLKKLNIAINNLKVADKGKGNLMSKSEIGNIYGKDMTISIKPLDGTSFKNGDREKSIEMYVPEKISITFPNLLSEKELMPYCYYENFLLEWNADPKNEEGLIVVAEYYGANSIPQENNEPAAVNVDIIENDNGRTVLDDDIWTGIPDKAVVYLSLLRGNIELEKVDGQVVKVYAETHAELPIILIRNENSVEFVD